MSFLQALQCQNTGSPPIWCLRQAGRYMAAYRRLRERYSFEELCCTPGLAAEVTLQPIQAFNFDAAILFSDILLPLKALSIRPSFEGREGPKLFGPPWTQVRRPADLSGSLMEAIGNVYSAAQILVGQLDRPLIGFSGAPWTLAAFIIEGGSSKEFRKAKAAIGTPELDRLISLLEDLVVEHLRLQVQAGCRVLQVFDSCVDLLAPSATEQYSFKPFERILRRLPPCPIIFYKARAGQYPSGAALSFDDSVDLSKMRPLLPPSTTIQGNLDPHWLLQPKEKLVAQVRRICDPMKTDPGFIFNLSRGILPETSEEAVQWLVDAVRAKT